MVVSSRALAAVGLGLVGLGVLVVPSLGQQAQQKDGAVRPTVNRPAASAASSTPPGPAVFGSVEMNAVLKGYDKFKVLSEEWEAAASAKQRELMQIMQEMKTESDMLAKYTPGSVDFKKAENKITELKAKGEAGRETAQRELALREAEMIATIFNEIQSMVSRVASKKGITYVLQVSTEPVSGSDPNSAYRAMQRSVLYADPRNDITKDVISYLNYEYKAAGGRAPKATSSAGPAATRPGGTLNR